MPPPPVHAIRVFDVLGSTNDSILAAGTEGDPEGTCHVARRQTHGRGRGSHAWWSPPGAGLWMSVLLRPRLARPQWNGLGLLAGRAAQRAILRLGARDVEVHWPNDLYFSGRKLGGILGEVRCDARGSGWVALGFGVNVDLTTAEVKAAMPADLRGRITCMTEAGASVPGPVVDLAQEVLADWWPLYDALHAGDALVDLVGDGLAHIGRRVRVVRPNRAVLLGTVAGLAVNGELLVEDDRGATQSVIAGEVHYGV